MAFEIREIPQFWIPLPDGRRLSARLWTPEGAGPAPAILEYLPYRLRDGTAARDASFHPAMAAAGFACVRVDMAGAGDSDGRLEDEYSEQELADGEAVIAWIAAQGWCAGAVGMIGISWGGFNGLQIAARRPPALKAVISLCATVDRHADDIHYMGGCLLTDNFNWGAGQMTAYMARPPDPEIRADWRALWRDRIARMPAFAETWLERPARNAYWRHGSVCEDFVAIQAPVLTIGGWSDAYVNAPFALAENLSAPCAALIGPWEHKYPHLSRILPSDMHGEAERWFGRWLAGRDTGAERPPRMRAFLTDGAAASRDYGPEPGRWVAEAEWPSPAVAPLALHLTQAGLSDAPGAGEIAAATPLTVGEGAGYFCPGMRVDRELCADQAEDDSRSVLFDGPPLDAPLEVLGRPVVEIAFRADRPAAQLVFRLCDVGPDGASRRVSYRAFNLTCWAGHEAPQALEPGRLYRASVPLNACGRRFAAGRRLRLAVSTSYWPVVWPSPEAATVTLDLAACRLLLPVRRGAGAGDPQAPDPQAPGPARPPAAPGVEALSPPVSETRRFVAADGARVLETLDDFGLGRVAGHGMEEAHAVRQLYSIRPDDPLSARHETRWSWRFARGGWGVSFETDCAMRCDRESFHLFRRIRARDDRGEAFEESWARRIPRGLL